ncbi:MAG TPA: cell wall-active antibiotics response protein LiaF [Bacteroidota bacterium]|nr:cell wall-active antibiotics response protein LiaF [Bacteroidota bacterium]
MHRSRTVWLGATLIVLGVLFLLDSTGLFHISDFFQTYWPLLLVLWGIFILIRRDSRRKDSPEKSFAGRVDADVTSETIDSANVFGEVDVRVTSSAFKGGSATTIFGDVSIDCRGGAIADGEHTLKISSVFGRSRLYVPPGSALNVSAHTLFGDASVFEQKRSGISAFVKYTTPGYETSQKRLRVDISQVFGEVLVRQ